jgi:SAM-dependent methyltransferase
MNEQLHQTVIEYYEELVARHGDSPLAVNYPGRQAQYQHFEVLASIAPLGGKRVLDVGCGLGHFYDFLKEHGITPKDYQGIDITPGMISLARTRYPQLEFATTDLLAAERPAQPSYDYVFACGIFHERGQNSETDWAKFCDQMIVEMFHYARYGLVFNMLTDDVAEKCAHNFYAQPGYYFELCRRQLSRRVSLRHDYPHDDFTLYVFRGER